MEPDGEDAHMKDLFDDANFEGILSEKETDGDKQDIDCNLIDFVTVMSWVGTDGGKRLVLLGHCGLSGDVSCAVVTISKFGW